MALFRKLFYRKPPDGLLEISEKVYVFDCCFTTDVWEEHNYKGYVGGIITQLREPYPDASILVFNFREPQIHSHMANALSEYDMTIMEYPRQYEGCPLLPMEVIHHFLRSSESWLSLGLQNLLLMHCERGGWPVLAFMLAALLIYRKQYSGEQKTLDMVYKQAPRELLNLLCPLNPLPSQLRYLQYVSRRNIATEWPPLDRALTMDCVIIRMIPDFDGEGGCRPIFRVYGQDPLLVSDRAPKVLFSTPKKSRTVRNYKQTECELVKIDINCRIQGDVVLECISLHDDMEREQMMFRVMFNTAFIRSNILMLNRDEIDLMWDAKDQFPKDFRAEILFSEMDSAAATSIVPVDLSCFEEKDGLPVEAFAKVHEIFSSVDWLVPKGDTTTPVEILQQIAISNTIIEAYSQAEKPQESQSPTNLVFPLTETETLIPKTPVSTPGEVSKDSSVDTGGPLFSPAMVPPPLTPCLEDKISAQSSVSPLPFLPPEVPRPSTSLIEDETTIRHSVSYRQSPRPSDSPTEDVVKATRVAPPPPPPPPPPSNHSSLTVDEVDYIKVGTNFPSSLNDTRTAGSNPPHISSPLMENIPLKTAAPVPPPAPSNVHLIPAEEISSSTCSQPQPLAPPPPPPPPPPPIPSLTENLVSTPEPCTPPLSLLPSNESTSITKGPLIPPPPLHSTPIPPFKENRTTKAGPPPPPPPPIKPPSATRSSPVPPPPPPAPPNVKTSIKGTPPPPPPPISHSVKGAGPTNPPSMSPPPPPPSPAPSVPPPPLRSNKEVANLSNSSVPGSPSPPPPSAPPQGAKARTLLSRTVTSRNNQSKKLKPLHWLKLSRAVSGSLWAEAEKSGEASKAPEIDISELESLFSAAVPNADQGGKTSLRAAMGNKPEKVQLIDHRRAYNCEIMLSKVKIPLPDLLSSVLCLEDSALDVDQVDNLIKFCPTKEEMELLKGYKGERDKLGKCEQFFLELMQVPRIESKLRVFSFKIQFRSQVSDLRKSLSIVNSAADQIRSSAKLKRIMQTILSLGNALNQGTARGSAIGFRLDSLLKLTDTRARNNKMTLMHYLCKVLADKLPELLDFWQDLSSLEQASKIQLKFLAEEMQAISKGLEKIVQELSISENDGPVSDNFRKALKEFLCFSEGEVRSLASLYSGVGRNVDALILYFGEDPARCPFEQVVSTLLNFVRMFKKAHEENCKQLEFERKKAEKEASAEKMNLNASEKDNGHSISRVRSGKKMDV